MSDRPIYGPQHATCYCHCSAGTTGDPTFDGLYLYLMPATIADVSAGGWWVIDLRGDGQSLVIRQARVDGDRLHLTSPTRTPTTLAVADVGVVYRILGRLTPGPVTEGGGDA